MSAPEQVPRASPFEASRLLLERAQEQLIAGNLGDHRLDEVRPLIRASWERSWRGSVAPTGVPPLDLFSDELDEYRRAHPLATAMDTIRALLLPGDDEDGGVVVAVGDQAGRLMWIEGDRRLRAHIEDVGFVAGANWSEGAVGTSAPGTALTLGHSVQIRGAEHYNRLVHPWSCSAAPVRDPETNRVLGVIDITGGVEVVTSQARMLVDATARTVEAELMVARLRGREEQHRTTPSPSASPPQPTTHARLHVLGRDRARLETQSDREESLIELSARHAAILLMLAVHREGLSAERLCQLVYGEGVSTDTLRPEMVRLRKVLERSAPGLVPDSRPYRLPVRVATDAHDVLSLLDRGAHRVALSAYRGPVLPESTSPGVEEFREIVRGALRETMLSEASLDALLVYAETPDGRDDLEVLQLALRMLPARSPKRSILVTWIEHLAAE
ncbi:MULTISPECIES: GAF domain-containing protein [unclassified Microbacterium]|uniref:GAF domain-containing protein n=1 Tax=unclassified Microbacterium TaxID=2609290 RepID=UPI000EAABC4C|nr:MULTISPECIES: GAF domain-containing protein [unclassified Microbacterium]MBT2484028.1 GAF domain-containing protein [Microbacterium sp. ISL-108]RKN66985.1 GAF domain-containing protein [Microbacterium sp. CGR2]